MKPILPHYRRTGSQHTGYRYVAEIAVRMGPDDYQDAKVTICRVFRDHLSAKRWTYRINLMVEGEEGEDIAHAMMQSCTTLTSAKKRVKTLLVNRVKQYET
jgi:hypothetical protein